MMKKALIAGFLVLIGPGLAIAQVVVPATTVVSTDPLTAQVATWLGWAVAGILTALAVWLSTYLTKKYGIQIDAGMRQTIIDYATNKAGELIAKYGSKVHFEFNVGNPLLAKEVQDAVNRIPDALKHFGVDVTSRQAVEDFISKFVVARLGLAQAAATPLVSPSVLQPSTGGMSDTVRRPGEI